MTPALSLVSELPTVFLLPQYSQAKNYVNSLNPDEQATLLAWSLHSLHIACNISSPNTLTLHLMNDLHDLTPNSIFGLFFSCYFPVPKLVFSL